MGVQLVDVGKYLERLLTLHIIYKSDEQSIDYFEDTAYTLPYLLFLRPYAVHQDLMEKDKVSMRTLQQRVSRHLLKYLLV